MCEGENSDKKNEEIKKWSYFIHDYVPAHAYVNHLSLWNEDGQKAVRKMIYV